MLGRTKAFFKKTRIEVTVDHEDVLFVVGNWELRLPYDVALKLSTKLRMAGKKAKKNAGDTSRHWSVVGHLTDANEDFKKGCGWS